MTDLEELAQKIATEAHMGQYRKDMKTPYITHPEAVANSFPVDHEIHRAIAWLHDVVEDTPLTCTEIFEMGIPQVVVDIVDILTHIKGEDYLTYLLRVKGDRMARDVKIADIKHNLSTLEPKNKTMRDKYTLALYILEEKR